MDSLIGQVVEAVDASAFGADTRMIHTSDHGDNLGVRGLWQKSNFQQESAHVPMIAVGPDVPVSKLCTPPVSLVDFHPRVLQCTGAGEAASRVNPDARSLLAIAAEPDDGARTVFGEYHAAGAVNGVYMLRQGPWKYVHYANMPAQLFNLDDDPEEMDDLAGAAGVRHVQDRFEAALRARLDPEGVDARIKARQRGIVESHGGTEAVLGSGSIGASPPPGTSFEGLRTE